MTQVVHSYVNFRLLRHYHNYATNTACDMFTRNLYSCSIWNLSLVGHFALPLLQVALTLGRCKRPREDLGIQWGKEARHLGRSNFCRWRWDEVWSRGKQVALLPSGQEFNRVHIIGEARASGKAHEECSWSHAWARASQHLEEMQVSKPWPT